MKQIAIVILSLWAHLSFADQAVIHGRPMQIKIAPPGQYESLPGVILKDLSIGAIIRLMQTSDEARQILSHAFVEIVTFDAATVLATGGGIRRYRLNGFEILSDADLKNAGFVDGLNSAAYIKSYCSVTGESEWNQTKAAAGCGLTPAHLERIKNLLNHYIYSTQPQKTVDHKDNSQHEMQRALK